MTVCASNVNEAKKTLGTRLLDTTNGTQQEINNKYNTNKDNGKIIMKPKRQ